MKSADVLIIGLGGAGGIAADVLTAAGAEVLALEAGPVLDTGDSRLDELVNDVQARLSAPKALAEAPVWRADATMAAGPSPWPVLMVNGVGGSTVHYPGLSARLHPWNFESRSRTVERYGAGAIPEGSTLADWPLSYEELEPAYAAVERAIGVAGAPASIFSGPRSSPYPLPPLRRTGWTGLTSDAAGSLGWHPFPAPAAINSEPYNGNPQCTYCGFCSGNVCHRDAKGSTDVTVIRRALATGRLRIVTGARVTRIDTGADGLATGATFVAEGREVSATARCVMLATFTYENVRLLLLSRSPAHPAGLANGSGQVGRHYMAHVTPFVFGLFPGRNLALHTGPWAQATCVEDWNADNFDHAGLGFIGGALLVAPHELRPVALAGAPVPDGVPRWGAGWKAWLREHAQSIGYISAQMECLPYDEHVLDLDPLARDPFGIPRVRITHRIRENELTGASFMVERMAQWLDAAGACQVRDAPAPVLEARHCYGGTRMGADPAESVVDAHGFAHEVPNLAILGTSTFPTTGGHNPTLTLQALAWRTAAHWAASA